MAANIPASIKAADLTRFVIRASQLEAVKPVIAYWCEYWIVNQILARDIHSGDAEALAYTMNLMDKLERIKSENATNDAIVDDTAGQAYVEQFGLETFQRADRAVQADKVTKQTADTFQAAATFLELVNIWSPPDAETLAKIKYAKYNAVRIIRALKEGKDPNETNPKKEPEPEVLPALDPNDPEVRGLAQGAPLQPYVEEVPDEQDKVEAKLARQSSIDQSLHPSAQVSARGSPAAATPAYDPYPRNGFPYTAVQDDNVSPMEVSPNERQGSVGGGYFPEVPTFTGSVPDTTLPTAPADDAMNLGLPDHPSGLPGNPSPGFGAFTPPPVSEVAAPPPQDFYREAPPSVPPSQAQHFSPPPVQPQQPTYQAPPQAPPQPYVPPPTQQYAPPPAPQQYAPSPAAPPVQLNNQQLNTDDMAIAKAQKHARWAISALNFEDAETAVRELRAALQTLGAQ